MIPLPRFLMREDEMTPRVSQSLTNRFKQKNARSMLKKAIQYENYLKICRDNNEKLGAYKKVNENELQGALRRQHTKTCIVPPALSNRSSNQQLLGLAPINQQLGRPACGASPVFNLAQILSDDDE